MSKKEYTYITESLCCTLKPIQHCKLLIQKERKETAASFQNKNGARRACGHGFSHFSHGIQVVNVTVISAKGPLPFAVKPRRIELFSIVSFPNME